jgi:hypothetical protein
LEGKENIPQSRRHSRADCGSRGRAGMVFPPAFLALYTQANGFKNRDWTEEMFSFWPIELIVEEYLQGTDPNFVGFCDYLFNSHTIGFLKNFEGIFKHYDLTKPIALSFEEGVELINGNSDLIY